MRRRYISYFAFLLFLVAVACSLYLVDRHSAKPDVGLRSIVSKGSLDETVLALGTLEPSSIVRVGGQVTGQIKAIHVIVGQSVVPGDLIAEIDAVPQENALRIAQAKVADTRAQRRVKQIQINQAESDFKRQQNLVGQNAVSRTAYEESEAKYQTLLAERDSLDAQIEQSEVDFETAKANLGYTRITAPIKGRVIAVPVEQGQTLNAAQTSPTIAIVANLDEMVVKVRISEADVFRTRPGQPSWFTVTGDLQTRYQAPLETVEYAPPSIANETTQEVSKDQQKDGAVYYYGILRVKNPDEKLRPKMTAQVRISVGNVSDAVLVPWGALSSRLADGSYRVKVRDVDGKVTERSIRIGLTDKINAQVLDGLQAGETVLLETAVPTAGD